MGYFAEREESTVIVIRLWPLLEEKFEREGRRMTLLEVSEMIGLSYTTVLRWTKNQIAFIDIPVLEKWCTFLECTPGDIIKLVPDVEEIS